MDGHFLLSVLLGIISSFSLELQRWCSQINLWLRLNPTTATKLLILPNMDFGLSSVSSPAEQLSSEQQWEQRNKMPAALSLLRNLSINYYCDALLHELFKSVELYFYKPPKWGEATILSSGGNHLFKCRLGWRIRPGPLEYPGVSAPCQGAEGRVGSWRWPQCRLCPPWRDCDLDFVHCNWTLLAFDLKFFPLQEKFWLFFLYVSFSSFHFCQPAQCTRSSCFRSPSPSQ